MITHKLGKLTIKNENKEPLLEIIINGHISDNGIAKEFLEKIQNMILISRPELTIAELDLSDNNLEKKD